ncbi:MAG: hypothetical protein RLZZ219_1719 [Cyanobacteriota bacterium]
MPPAALREAQASAATVAWRRLDAPSWPVPPAAFPPGAALVGGAVRDALLDRLGPRPDLDLVLPGDAVEACRQLRRRHGGSAVVLDAERSIARLVVDGWSIDLARQEGGCLEADLQRRDYTINAMALPLASPDQLVDPLGGAVHLVNGELVAVAEANLLDDPLRLLRGLRLAAELDFRLETRTQGWIAIHAPRLATVAGERVLAELEKLAAAPEGHRQLREVLRCGLLAPWRGETPTATADSLAGAALLSRLGVAEADQLGLTPAEQGEALPLARLAAVLDEPSLQRLRSSRRWQQRVGSLRHWRQRLGSLEPAAAAAALPEPERLRLQRQLEQDLPALLLGWPAVEGRVWLARWRDGDDPLFHPRPAIDGGTLQRELGIEASPRLGALLEHLMRERAFGRVQQRHELLQQARSWLHSAHGDGDQDPRRG